jgi:hypothetical protein
MACTRGFRVRSVKAYLSLADIPDGRTPEQAAGDVRSALARRYQGAVVTCELLRPGRNLSFVQIDTDEFRKAAEIIRRAAKCDLSGDVVIA